MKNCSRSCAWSRNFTPTLNEKANFRKFLRSWFGRDLTKAELDGFDTETLIGKSGQIVVVHEHRDGETYANIVACTPDKSPEPMAATGKYVRVKDRPAKDGSTSPRPSPQGGEGASYRRSEQPPSSGGMVDHAAVKVHVGKYKGIELRDLNLEAVQALCEKWLPGAKANAKPLADDKRLIAALDWWLSTQTPKQPEDDLPY